MLIKGGMGVILSDTPKGNRDTMYQYVSLLRLLLSMGGLV